MAESLNNVARVNQGEAVHSSGSCSVPEVLASNRLTEQVDDELLARWERQQSEYRSMLILEDSPDIERLLSDSRDPHGSPQLYVGGLDVSFIKGNNLDACACLTVTQLLDLKVVYQRIELTQITQPYVPGYLAFREVSPLLDLLSRLRTSAPHYWPQVIMVDGNGLLHPRGFGLASHLGVLVDIPTIGVAKTLISAGGISDDPEHKKKKQTLLKGGDYFDLISETGEVLGRCLRSVDRAPNPIYISVGHRITLESAMQVCIKCSQYRIPEPVRRADIDSREYLRQQKHEPYEFIQT